MCRLVPFILLVLAPWAYALNDLNDLYFIEDKNCNNYGSNYLSCTQVSADYCCYATMPFCYVGIYDSADCDYSLTAWKGSSDCDFNIDTPLKCKRGECTCQDATTPGSTSASCSALWSRYVKEGKQSRMEARSGGSGPAAGCRHADTLHYLDPTNTDASHPDGVPMRVANITSGNAGEVMGLYGARDYEGLSRWAFRVPD